MTQLEGWLIAALIGLVFLVIILWDNALTWKNEATNTHEELRRMQADKLIKDNRAMLKGKTNE